MKTAKEYAAIVEEALNRYLMPAGNLQGTADKAPEIGYPAEKAAEMGLSLGDIPEPLISAMRYSLLAGGKRLRPGLLLATMDALGADIEEGLPYACALEMIHTYSLIHDDLPGMDNDTLRRGKPTSHVVFGEGQAILAGDGLLSEAFELMLRYARPEMRYIRAMQEVAFAAGSRGMVAGQCVDLLCEKEQKQGETELGFIHMNKTARMLIAPLRAGAILAGADEEMLAKFTDFARPFGLLFQVTDDLLDVVGDASVVGKSIGKDAEEGKLTYVTFYGEEIARQKAVQLQKQAEEALAKLPCETEYFRKLLDGMIGRTF